MITRPLTQIILTQDWILDQNAINELDHVEPDTRYMTKYK